MNNFLNLLCCVNLPNLSLSLQDVSGDELNHFFNFHFSWLREPI